MPKRKSLRSSGVLPIRATKVIRSSSATSFNQSSQPRPESLMRNENISEDRDDDSYSTSTEISTGDNPTTLCSICKQDDVTHLYETTTISCSVCSSSFHGTCLSLDSSLLPYLYVVEKIGGWCCSICQTRLKNSKLKGKTPKTRPNSIPHTLIQPSNSTPSLIPYIDPIVAKITSDLSELKLQIQLISQSLKPQPQPYSLPLSHPPNPIPGVSSAPIGRSYSDIAAWPHLSTTHSHLPTSTRDQRLSVNPLASDTKTAVLSAVHSEFSAISHRSLNIVVSGLHPHSDLSDASRFSSLCDEFFAFIPTIRSTFRLGTAQAGRVQPLLVSLTSSSEVEHLVTYAKILRTASDPAVRDFIYINRHLTKAESLSAFEARNIRRSKEQSKLSAPPPTLFSPPLHRLTPSSLLSHTTLPFIPAPPPPSSQNSSNLIPSISQPHPISIPSFFSPSPSLPPNTPLSHSSSSLPLTSTNSHR